MSEITLIEGEIFSDSRGQIHSLNNFNLQGVERLYTIIHPDKSIIRGWHGHQFEKKWFFCLKGEFNLWFVKPDSWKEPSTSLIPHKFTLNQTTSKIICIPEGYANCIKATQNDSILLVLSGNRYPKCLDDSYRWGTQMWGGNNI